MEACDFLFPKELRVTPSAIRRVLVIGSCLSEAYADHFRGISQTTHFDYLAFNNVSELPDEPPGRLADYDFIVIQLALRYVVTDRVIAFSEFSSAKQNEVIVSDAFDRCRQMLDACLKYSRSSRALTFVCNFVVPQTPIVNALDRVGTTFDFCALVRRLNDLLAHTVADADNVFIADVESLSGSMGKQYFLDDYVAFHSHSAFWGPYHTDFDTSAAHNGVGRIEPLPPLDQVYWLDERRMLRAVWALLESLYRTRQQIDAVKLVVFDLDDTLWRGQIAEHYVEGGAWPHGHGWPLGIWEAIQHLRARGILTAICSKNTVELVRERWDRAVPLPWISLDDFLFKEINWNNKADNIARIIQQASLTPKSVLFVDDNPVEREAVSAALPGLRVIGANPYLTKRILLWSAETQIATVSSETEKRESMVRRQQVRETERLSVSRDEFLAGLQCEVSVFDVAPSSAEFSRAFELLNKTNQFNTTGERHSVGQIGAFFDAGGRMFAFRAKDRFTEYGLVGVVLYKNGHFGQFAMSCRVLGLDIETSVVRFLIARERRADRSTAFSATVRKTESNAVCRDVYRKCGFEAGEPERLPHGAGVDPAAHLTISDLSLVAADPV